MYYQWKTLKEVITTGEKLWGEVNPAVIWQYNSQHIIFIKNVLYAIWEGGITFLNIFLDTY